jgi:dihydrofolate synthase/folylpolyglutamate synthase
MDTVAIKAYLNSKNNPQHSYKTIHIGGSNGKGSTGYFLSQMLEHLGYKVGYYYSPFTMDRFDNILIQNESIKNVLNKYLFYQHEMISAGLTEFEQDTALAFLMFSEEKVDYAIIEVGLGGIYDATNVIQPDIGIITSTSLEHAEIIGPSIYDIATHQAGIIKKGMQVLLSKSIDEDIKKVFLNQINEVSAVLINDYPIVKDHVFPHYQENNVSLAFQALNLIKQQSSFPFSILKTMPFRFQYITHNVIFDGAHNLEGIQALIDTLQKKQLKPMVYMSILNTKKYDDMIQTMMTYTGHVYVTSFEHQQSIQFNDIAHIKGAVWVEIQEIIERIKTEKYDTILITGSLYFLRTLKRLLEF